jgi:hypothetical protein
VTTTARPVCDSPEELTPDWLTAALGDAGVGTAVADVSHRRVGNGQIGTSYRLRVTYADPDAAAAEGAPATLVAKMAAGDPGTRQIIAGGYRNEVGFYQDLVGGLAVRAPRCWYAAISDDSTCFVLLLEDVSPAQPGDQVRGCTVEEARAAVVNLAGLHGPRWNDPALEEGTWFSRHDEAGAELYAQAFAGAVPTFLDRFGARLSADDPTTLDDVAEHLAAWLLARPERSSLIHGDYRPDNLMFAPDGTVTALDWQTLGLGLPGRDVGYLLGTSLDPGLRRRAERDLVAAYHQALTAHGVDDHDVDVAFEDYRLGVVQGPLTTVLGAVYAQAPNEASDAMFTAMITRSLAAIRDLRPFDLL